MIDKWLQIFFIGSSVLAIGLSNDVEKSGHIPNPKIDHSNQHEELNAINLYMTGKNPKLNNESYFRVNSKCFEAEVPDGFMYHCDRSFHVDATTEAIDVVCSEDLLVENIIEIISDRWMKDGWKDGQGKLALYLHFCPGAVLSLFLERSLANISEFYIDCGKKNFILEDLPSDKLMKVEELTISCSQWSYLPVSLFYGKMPRLRNLTIRDTKIKNFEEGALSNLSRLSILKLLGNGIESLKNGDFSSLTSLKYLDIQEPNLCNIDSDIFRYTPDLEFLRIIDANIFRLPVSFQELKLKEFEVLNSKIQMIKGSECVNLKKLEVLRIINNPHLDLDSSCFQYLTEAFKIHIIGNNVTALPEKAITFRRLDTFHFGNNEQNISKVSNFISTPNLRDLVFKDLSIQELHPSFFLDSVSSVIYSIDISNNCLSLIPPLPQHVSRLILSNNYLNSLGNNSSQALSSVRELHLDGNRFQDKYLLNGTFENLITLRLNNNDLREVPELDMPNLKYLYLSNNRIVDGFLQLFEGCKNLEELDLSQNNILRIDNTYYIEGLTKLRVLNVSFNSLRPVTGIYFTADEFKCIDLSGNGFEKFDLEWIKNFKMLEELNLRRNSISYIEIDDYYSYVRFHYLKKMDLSYNCLSSRYWFRHYDEDRKSMGLITAFLKFPNLKELYLAHNDITEIPMDIRNMMPKLRIVDLRYNKIKHLSYQELLFTSSFIFSNGTVIPYGKCDSITVDVRHNLIHSLELPQYMLVKNVTQKCEKHRYSHATLLLDDNPIDCDCDVISLLRVIEGDVILASELWRENKQDWVLQAKIVPGNLSCSRPESVKGKRVAEIETWMHHLLPTLGVCNAMGYLK